jgi:hypothetical protein
MITKYAIITLAMGMLLAAASSRASAQVTTQNNLPPAAFCCTSFDATDTPEQGLGCYAVTSGVSSIAACTGVYFQCTSEDFTCAPEAVMKRVAGSEPSLACSCGFGGIGFN